MIRFAARSERTCHVIRWAGGAGRWMVVCSRLGWPAVLMVRGSRWMLFTEGKPSVVGTVSPLLDEPDRPICKDCIRRLRSDADSLAQFVAEEGS